MLDIDPVRALKEDFAAEDAVEDEPERSKYVQRTASHIILAGLTYVDSEVSESDCRSILSLLSQLLTFVLGEDIDELLRSVTLDAVFMLGQISTSDRDVSTKGKGKTAMNGSHLDQLAVDTKSALQVCKLQRTLQCSYRF